MPGITSSHVTMVSTRPSGVFDKSGVAAVVWIPAV